MAMTQCPDCGKEVSGLAPACPNCGYPVADEAEKAAAEKEKKSGLQGFVDFIRKHGVVGLAIGFIVGVAVGALVTSLVANLVSPIIAMIAGKADIGNLTFTINNAVFYYGKFIMALIDFIVILAVVYFGFKWFRLEKLDAMK